jgi:hypothetical protein
MHPSEALSPSDAFGARTVAVVLDLGLCAVAAGPLSGGAGWLMALVFFLLYLGVYQGITGWSLAKAVLGVKVVKQGTLDPPGPVGGLVRTVLAVLDLALVGLVMVIVDARRRRVGDLAGGTEVVGLAPSARMRTISALAYFGLLSLFVLLSSVSTFLITWAIFVPVAIGFLVVILGHRRLPTAWPWLAGLAYTLPAACYMSFVSLCHRGEKTCVDLAEGHKAIPALIIVVVAIALVFAARGAWVYVAVAALTAVAEIYMLTRLWNGEDMRFGGILEILLLVFALATEYVRYVARRKAERLAAVGPSTAAA